MKDEYMDFLVVDNFFDNLDVIKDSFKNVPRYSLNEFNKKFNKSETWPGYRSDLLDIAEPFLYNLLMKEIGSKLNYIPIFKNCERSITCFMHLRLDKDD